MRLSGSKGIEKPGSARSSARPGGGNQREELWLQITGQWQKHCHAVCHSPQRASLHGNPGGHGCHTGRLQNLHFELKKNSSNWRGSGTFLFHTLSRRGPDSCCCDSGLWVVPRKENENSLTRKGMFAHGGRAPSALKGTENEGLSEVYPFPGQAYVWSLFWHSAKFWPESAISYSAWISFISLNNTSSSQCHSTGLKSQHLGSGSRKIRSSRSSLAT